MLTPDEVVEATRDLWKRLQDELPGHDRVRGYARGLHGVPEVPDGAGEELEDIAKCSVLNIMVPVVNAFVTPLSVEGFRSATDETNAEVWKQWQADRLDARQAEVYRPAATYGCSYVIGLKDETRIRSPRQAIAVYEDPHMDLWPIYALEHWIDNSGLKPVRKGHLYDGTHVYPVDLGNAGIRMYRVGGEQIPRQAVRIAYEEDDAYEHGAETCPVIRFVNDRDAEDLVMGEVYPLIRDQRAINGVNFDRLVVSRFGAFEQKYIIGWTPESETALKRASAARLMQFDDGPDDVKVGSFPASSVVPYNSLIDSLFAHIAKKAQIPVGAIMDKAENVGADTIAALDAPYQNKLNAKRRSYGESWEQYLRLKAALHGIEVPDDAEVVWDETEARSYAQVIDGISKLIAGDPALLPELLQDIPGWNQQRIDSARAALRRGAGRRLVDQVRNAGAGTEPPAA